MLNEIVVGIIPKLNSYGCRRLVLWLVSPAGVSTSRNFFTKWITHTYICGGW